MLLPRSKIDELLAKGRLLWCNTHQRKIQRCWVEGGILMPCDVVDLTDEVEIEE